MSRRTTAKPFWEMTSDELAEATKEFDELIMVECAAKQMTCLHDAV